MRSLVIMMAVVGFVVGLIGVAAWQYYLLVHGDVAWTTYAPMPDRSAPFSAATDWWPAVVALPVAGVLLGAGVAALMNRFGWRLSRKP